MAGRSDSRQPPVRAPERSAWMALLAFTAFVLVGLALRLPDGGVIPLAATAAALVAVAAGAVLFVTGPAQLLAWAVVAAAGVAFLGHGRSSSVGWFAVAVLVFWCALWGSRRDALLLWGGLLAVFAAEWILVQHDPGWAAWMAGVSMAVLGGLLIRHEFTLVADLRAAQAELADRARTEERHRIARELHDVIAHSLTVSLLHLASARMAVLYDPAGAVRALEEAERLGRESLDEVRATVGLLRVDGDAPTGRTPPLPGAAELPALIEGFRSAGAEVELVVLGDPEALPATTALAVYRIVQEAVTNAVKHAPGAPVTVELDITGATAELAVSSAGQPGSGSGAGLVSMRERAEALGGSLSAGPGGPGWLVCADLPLPAARKPERAT